MSTPSPSSSSSIWVLSNIKLQFFARIRRFLQSKATRKRCDPSDRFDIAKSRAEQSIKVENIETVQVMEKHKKRGRACDPVTEDCEDASLWELGREGGGSKEIERLAKEDVKVASRRRAGLTALIHLADGTYTNKALIVEAGILSKLPKTIDFVDESTMSEFAELLLSLSSLANTQFPLTSLDFLPLLREILETGSSNFDTKGSCLGALYNLSTVLENAGPLVCSGVVPTLLELSLVKEISEKALATLGNLLVTSMGKKAIENSSMVPKSFIEILSWEDKPKCQELMKGKQRWGHIQVQTPRFAMGSPVNQRDAKEGKKLMKTTTPLFSSAFASSAPLIAASSSSAISAASADVVIAKALSTGAVEEGQIEEVKGACYGH
ncbi:Armadillo-type fold [Sesbania bispinosa]|nr:Armadillo-type fold [Sesbania bispinosa]